MILGTAWNYGWDGVRAYAHSVVNSGYKGRKVLFTFNLKDDAIGNLRALGWELIPYVPTPNLHPITTRWEPVLKYLSTSDDELVIVTDVNDCVFQRDPFPQLEKLCTGKVSLICATESILVGQESTMNGWSDNMRWCVAAVGREKAESVADQEVLCHGTFAGTAKSILMYVNRLYDQLRGHKNPRLIDQGLGQWLLRQEPFSSMVYVPRPSEGFILSGNFCWNSGMDPAPRVERGKAYPAGSQEPFAIVHLTRHANLNSLVKAHWWKEWDGYCCRCGFQGYRVGMYGPRCIKCGNHHMKRHCSKS